MSVWVEDLGVGVAKVHLQDVVQPEEPYVKEKKGILLKCLDDFIIAG